MSGALKPFRSAFMNFRQQQQAQKKLNKLFDDQAKYLKKKKR